MTFTPTLEPSASAVKSLIHHHLKFTLARDPQTATKRDWWIATSKAVQDYLIERMIATMAVHHGANVRRIYYMSLEFLVGRLLSNNLYSAGVFEPAREALKEIGLDLEDLRREEYDMGLGNGGLGRLAACFLDSMATLDLPAIGYGIRYDYGLFRQEFVNGHQVEHPDDWLKFGDPWEIVRPEYTQTVHLFGQVEEVFDSVGRSSRKWVQTRQVLGIPYDIPIAGFQTNTVNFLRLWHSRATEEFDLTVFNEGGYDEAVRQKNIGETISKVLYPNDKTENGKELRLIQQYFFVCCSLQDIIRRFRSQNSDWAQFPEKVAVQLNDTHPSIAVAELMRILHDEEGLTWEAAWSIVTRTFAYTNHTLMPEALEKWSVPLFRKVLPRHLDIIYEINRRHLEEVAQIWPGDVHKLQELSLIDENGPQFVRMAHLAVVGSHSVNGVAALHTDLLKRFLFADFNTMFPNRINNKTNGITPRRWLLSANPKLCDLLDRTIGTGYVKDLERLRALEPYADNPEFQQEFMAIKRANKLALARIIERDCHVYVNPDAIFDVQIKRLHEYKRQHLNLLHILTLYRRLLQNPNLDIQPRVFIFAAKAAPGYDLAKCIIKAINAVGHKINHDPRINDKLKVAFLPNYRVSLCQRIVPAADLSEQISTAGKEASGTGNMKLALNGALTIGTLDGANVEIQEEVGDENIFIFGLTVEEVQELVAKGYDPRRYYEQNEELRAVVDWLVSNQFAPEEPGVLQPLRRSLLDHGDPYLVMADYAAYVACQQRVNDAYADKARWARMAILNTARVGKFSSDRTIRQYANEIWRLGSISV